MKRIIKLQELLKSKQIDQVLVSDTLSIYYLIGKRFSVHERFIALLVRNEGTPILFLNNLFPSDEINGIEIVRFNDSDDYLSVCQISTEGDYNHTKVYVMPEKDFGDFFLKHQNK